LLERQKSGHWDVRQILPPLQDPQENPDPEEWRGAFMGVAFAGERGVYASEGNSGRVSYFDSAGERRRFIDLNQGDFEDSYSGDLALDPVRNILYVVDQANFRVAVIDVRT